MQIKHITWSAAFCFFVLSCSSNTEQKPENNTSEAVIEEIQTLDSLNQEIEASTQEIEASINNVEAAISELDNFE